MPHHETYIAGVKFRKGARELIDGLEDGTALSLEREPTNEYDPYAVKVICGGLHIGYVPRDLAAMVGNLIAQDRCTDACLSAAAAPKSASSTKTRPAPRDTLGGVAEW